MSDNTFYSEFVRGMFKTEPVSAEDVQEYINDYEMLHAVVGLAGEASEVLDAVKKVVFVGKPLDLEVVKKELGDVEFYLQAVRNCMGVTRDEILNINVEKLNARHPEGFEASTFYEGN